jgi:hypothetical protein
MIRGYAWTARGFPGYFGGASGGLRCGLAGQDHGPHPGRSVVCTAGGPRARGRPGWRRKGRATGAAGPCQARPRRAGRFGRSASPETASLGPLHLRGPTLRRHLRHRSGRERRQPRAGAAASRRRAASGEDQEGTSRSGRPGERPDRAAFARRRSASRRRGCRESASGRGVFDPPRRRRSTGGTRPRLRADARGRPKPLRYRPVSRARGESVAKPCRGEEGERARTGPRRSVCEGGGVMGVIVAAGGSVGAEGAAQRSATAGRGPSERRGGGRVRVGDRPAAADP